MCKRAESHGKGLSLVALMAVWMLTGCGGGGGGGEQTSGNATGGAPAGSGSGGSLPDAGASVTPTTPGVALPLSISAAPAGQVMVGAIYSLQPQVMHASGAVSYSIDNLPEWADFNTDTGRLVGVPSARDVGATQDIIITVQDARQRVSLARFQIIVVPRPDQMAPPLTPVDDDRPGHVVLTWEVPTLAVDGALLANLEGYRVHYGADAEAMVHVVELQGSGNNMLELANLDAGRHYFAVRSLRIGGEVSALSNIVSRQVK